MSAYMDALDKLGMIIFEMLAHGLGLPDNFFTKRFTEKDSTMIRINRYPPCPLPEKCLGLGSHSDPHTLTILFQDEVGGLQVLRNDNQWIGIRPIPNSFIINIGDTLEVRRKLSISNNHTVNVHLDCEIPYPVNGNKVLIQNFIIISFSFRYPA